MGRRRGYRDHFHKFLFPVKEKKDELVETSDFSDLIPSPSEEEGNLNPLRIKGNGPPVYSNFSDLTGDVEVPLVLSGDTGPTIYPDLTDPDDPDMGRSWIVVRIPESDRTIKKVPWAQTGTKIIKSLYGIISADESDRWEDWSGPYTQEEAAEVVANLTMISTQIMET